MTYDPNENARGTRKTNQERVATQGRAAGALLELEILGVQVNFRWAPAGSFLMGSPENEDGHDASEKQHRVTLTKGFWIAETETTQELWQNVMGNNPSQFKGSKNLPVENISWNDCRDFIERLNARFRETLPPGYVFAMPTEAQWEYACRAGTSTPFHFGSILNGGKANVNGTIPYGTSARGFYQAKTMPVRSYAPNQWGLYDMHGNVKEWCADWYDEYYYATSSASKDPTGPDTGATRVLRDGPWNGNAISSRAANRSSDAPGDHYEDYGFRLVLVQVSQAQDSREDADDQERSDAYESQGEHKPGARKTLEINGVQVDFRWAPAGSFRMGSPEGEEGRRYGERLHAVTLTQGFWIAETPTTQDLWLAVMENNPSEFHHQEKKQFKTTGVWSELGSAAQICNPDIFAKSDQLPVESVSWEDCQAFVDKLNSYFKRALPPGYKYAMPTEAQWEYACRAGTTTPFSFGSALNGDKANCNGYAPHGDCKRGSYEKKTTHVRSYAPNPWKIYDMHGNVLEWCADWYDEDYYATDSATIDPTGPTFGSARVLRGGSWLNYPRNCRSADRYECDPDVRHKTCGFRLVLVLDSQPPRSQTEEAATQRQRHNNGEQRFNPHTPNQAQYSDQTRPAGELLELKIADVPVNFHWAPADSFLMGSPLSENNRYNDETQHEVTLTKGFWIAETETTQELWEAVMGNNPSYYTGDKQLPVDSVSWYDCQKFVQKLNRTYGATLPSGYKYAMPTEAQWEYACRAGTTTPFSFGSTLNGDKANCNGDSPYGTSTKGVYRKATTPVRSYAANAWGLYDMHGNQWEWCADWYGSYDTSSSATSDPAGSGSGSNRVLRGGSWSNYAENCRSAYRYSLTPGYRSSRYGFRLVLVR